MERLVTQGEVFQSATRESGGEKVSTRITVAFLESESPSLSFLYHTWHSARRFCDRCDRSGVIARIAGNIALSLAHRRLITAVGTHVQAWTLDGK